MAEHDHFHHDPANEHHHEGEVPIYDRGLAFDLDTVVHRRRMLGLLAGVSAVPLVSGLAGARSASAALLAACEDIPEETAGPFPADGSNGPNVLDDTGIVRRNIRHSFGEASGFAEGVRMTMQLTILELAADCAPYRGAAVYVWQCDRDGNYSMYEAPIEGENYLRGVQRADRFGRVTFTSTFPGCYPGRWPHVHFEVYPSIREAVTYENKIATSQLALTKAACKTVYRSAGYEASREAIKDVSLETDGVFRDGWDQQLARMRGNVRDGYTAKLKLSV